MVRSLAKGDRTRTEILELAWQRALKLGLDEGLSIGPLATEAGMSKSGLFAHFGSKEGLQIALLDHAAASFVERVVRPALAAPRGEPRLRALYSRWLGWAATNLQSGGCLFSAAAWEFDDRPGPVRDRIAAILGDWSKAIEKAVRLAMEEGHLRGDIDAVEVAQHIHSLQIGMHLYARLFRNRLAATRAERAFDQLLETLKP
jgi:AcrR family transcriptional regulator